MIHRIILFSLLATNSIFINAMDGFGGNPFAPNVLRKTPDQSTQEAINAGEKQFQAGSASDEQEAISWVLAPYLLQVKIAQKQTVSILGLYTAYLNDQASDESEKAKSQRNFAEYKALLEALKTDRNLLYNTYWSGPSVKLYTTHPEFFELSDKVSYAYKKVREIEGNHSDRIEELFVSNLLLSIPIGSFHETLHALKNRSISIN